MKEKLQKGRDALEEQKKNEEEEYKKQYEAYKESLGSNYFYIKCQIDPKKELSKNSKKFGKENKNQLIKVFRQDTMT